MGSFKFDLITNKSTTVNDIEVELLMFIAGFKLIFVLHAMATIFQVFFTKVLQNRIFMFVAVVPVDGAGWLQFLHVRQTSITAETKGCVNVDGVA